MYIKKVVKRNRDSDTAYEYLHLVENVRTPAGPRQRLILNLGSLDIPHEQFKELANCIEGILLGQPNLFSPDIKIEKLAKQAVHRIFSKTSESTPSEQKFELDDLKKMAVIRTDRQGEIQVEVMRRQEPSEVLLLCRSKGRRDKENSMRSHQEKAFLERLEYFRQGLSEKGHTKKYSKILEMVGRLRERYPGVSKLYDVEVTPADTKKGEIVQAKNIAWKKRPGKEQEDSWEGCYVLRTNRLDLKDQEIWETYTMLTKIENAFRALKTSLGLRPNFHQKEQRADNHLFISVLAYHILHAIEWKLEKHGDHRNWETIRQILSTHHRLTLEFKQKSPQGIEQKFLRMCSKPEPEQKMIYHCLGIKEVPLLRKKLDGSKISSDEKKQAFGSEGSSQPPT